MRIEDAYARLDEAARLATARGSLIFNLDLATEAARAAFTARGMSTEALAATADESGYAVFAFAPGEDALAEARFDDRGDVIVVARPAAIPPRAATLARARQTVLADAPDRVVIVVPASDPRRPIEAYALSVESPDIMRVADHVLLTLDPAGRRIESRNPLAASVDQDAVAVGAQRVVTLRHDGATPNELHVYLSLKHGVALSVETADSGLVWRVDGERVSRR